MKTIQLIAFLICLFLFGIEESYAKNIPTDKEITSKLQSLNEDTAKIDYLRSVVIDLNEENPSQALQFLNQAKKLATANKDPYWIIKVLKTEAYYYHNLDNEKASKNAFKEAFSLAKENSFYDMQMEVLYAEIKLNLDKGKLEDVVPKSKYLHPILNKLPSRESQADYLSQIGRDYYSLGNYAEAMKYYVPSQDIYEKYKIRNEGYGHLLHNIGSVFKRQGDYEKALSYYEKELKLGKEIKSDNIIAEGLYLSAGMLNNTGQDAKARKYNQKSLAIYEKLGNKTMIALLTGNMASDYSDRGDYMGSIRYLQKALDIFLEENEANKIAWIQSTMAKNYSKLRMHDKALALIKQAKESAMKSTKKQLLRLTEITEDEAFIYYRMADYKNAFDTYMDFIALDDSLNDKEKLEVVESLEAKYENEKQQAQIALLNKDKEMKVIELEKKEAEVNEQKTMRNGMVLIIALIIIGGGFLYRGYRINKQNNRKLTIQNDEINFKNLVIEEKNKNITDSIAYAKRIQKAILPPQSLLNDYLKTGFIYYEPKDVVAGDFYWLEKQAGKILFAAADCTGHGVPGAMISVVCHNALNRAVREFGLTEPALILDKVRELVIETFEKSEENVTDGMDISLCSLDKEKNILQYAGANNPLYIVRNEELLEYKADKQPISKHIDTKPFTLHNIKLKKGDIIYSFTDGFADQFGGEKGKKFKYKPFKELLISIRKETMDDQFKIIKETFHSWRGDLEQIDDVCILGVKV